MITSPPITTEDLLVTSHQAMPVSVKTRLDQIIIVGLGITLAFTGLTHGAVEPWYIAIFELIVTLLALLLVIKLSRERESDLYIPAPVWPMIGLLAFGLVQSFSYHDAAGNRVSLSLDVEATRSALLALLALIAVTVIAANVINSGERLKIAAYFLTFYGLAMALFALCRYFYLSAYSDSPDWAVQGTFINHNHFAGHMELILPIPIALVITNAVPGKRLFFAFAAIVIGVVTIASLSRAGMLSIGAQMLLMLVLSPVLASGKHKEPEHYLALVYSKPKAGDGMRFLLNAGLITLFAGAIIMAALWFDQKGIISRLTQNKILSDNPGGETFFMSRGWAWQSATSMFQAHPLTGIGLGAFPTAFAIYNHVDLAWAPEQAHGDYHQILADAGIIGGALALCFIVLVLRNIILSLRARDRFLGGIALGCGAGIFGMLVHSIFDFNLQLTSNSFLFLMLVVLSARLGTKVIQ